MDLPYCLDRTISSLKRQSPASSKKHGTSRKLISCAVPSCRKDNRRNPNLHFLKFPSDENRCWKWVKAIGDPDLVHVPVEKLSTLRRICSSHFSSCKFSGPSSTSGKVRLNSTAVPNIFDPSVVPLSDEVMKEFVGFTNQQSLKKNIAEALEVGRLLSSQIPQSTLSEHMRPGTSCCELVSRSTHSLNSKQLEHKVNFMTHADADVFSSHIIQSQQKYITSDLLVGNDDGCGFTRTPATIQNHLTSESNINLLKVNTGFSFKTNPSQSLLHRASTQSMPCNPSNRNSSSLRDKGAVLQHTTTSADAFGPLPLQVYPMRIQPGQEITSFLQNFVSVKGLKAAFILTCVGSVSNVDLRFATDSKGSHAVSQVNRNLEICSLVGTVCTDGFHLHGTFGDSVGATISGHVLGNMIVQTTAEIVLGQVNGIVFNRIFDPSTGFRELAVVEDLDHA